jgi:trimethylamine--corrinoid protein Co-methyltransferase
MATFMPVLKNIEVLDKRDLDFIHTISLEILEKIGVKFQEKRSLDILENHGMSVDRRSGIVKFDPDYVDYIIKKAPREFTMYAQNPKKDLRLEKDSIFYATANAISLIENNKKRDILKEDFIKLTMLSDVLESVDIFVGTNFYEAPKALWDLYEFEIMLTYSSKHLRPVVGSPTGPVAILEMAAEVVGGYDNLRKRPILSMGYAADAPLRWSSTALKVFIESAEYNVPINVESEPITGCTSPITLAGTLVIANAEALSGIVFNQMLKEGRPTVYSIGFTHTMDMRTSTCLSATPECFLIAIAGGQLAKYYNLPSLSWVTCDSKTVDIQSSCEKAMGFTLHSLSGNNIIWGIGSLEMQSSISFEQMIIDDEIIRYLKRINKGIELTEKTIALDIIKDVGVGGNYLSNIKSLLLSREYYLKEHSQPIVFDRRSRHDWDKDKKDLISKAREKISEFLKMCGAPVIDRDTQQNLQKIIKKYQKENLK